MQQSRVNWAELIFDIGLLLYVQFIMRASISSGTSILSFLSPAMAIMAAMYVNFVVTWSVFGRVRNYYRFYIEKKAWWLVLLAFLVALFIFFSMYFGMVDRVQACCIAPERELLVFAIIPSLWIAIVIGLLFGITEVYRKGQDTFAARLKFARIALFFLTFIYSIGIAYDLHRFFSMRGFFMGVVMWFACMATIGGLAELLLRFIGQRRDGLKIAEREKIARRFHNYLLPFMIVTALFLWDEFYIYAKVKPVLEGSETMSTVGLVFFLFYSGFIPFRLLLAFEPPVKWYHLLGGLCSLGYYCYSLLLLVPTT